MHIDPTHDQAVRFGGSAAGDDTPVFMLNLLRFADTSADGDSGMAAYGRYAAATAPHLARVGGEVVWAGACDAALIGPEDPEWHVAAVVRYPSRTAFLDMVKDPEYQEVSKIRTGALADARLIPCAQTTL